MKTKLGSPLWVVWKEIGFGVTAFFCFAPRHPVPVGHVYTLIAGRGRSGKNECSIVSSYVDPWARRNGIRTELNRAIFKNHKIDVIRTADSTRQGEAWMRACGYKFDKRTGSWSVTAKEFAKATKGRSDYAKD